MLPGRAGDARKPHDLGPGFALAGDEGGEFRRCAADATETPWRQDAGASTVPPACAARAVTAASAVAPAARKVTERLAAGP